MRNPESDRLVAAPDFRGPTENRHCTDVLCLLLLLATWVVMTGLGLAVIQKGDHRVVFHPMDYDGNICGIEWDGVDMSGYDYLYFVNRFVGVCVDRCPNLDNVVQDGLVDISTLITYSGIYQADGAELTGDNLNSVIRVGNYSLQTSDEYACSTEKCYPDNDSELSWSSEGVRANLGYAFYLADTRNILKRCFIRNDAMTAIQNKTNAEKVDLYEEDIQDALSKLVNDIWVSRKYVLGFGFGASFGLSLIYVVLMRLPFLLNFMVWGSIFATILMFFVGGYFTLDADTRLQSVSSLDVVSSALDDDRAAKAAKIAAYALFAIGGLLLLLTICLRKAIQTAITCTKEAAKAINAMPLIFSVPIIQVVAFLIFLAAFLAYGVHLASMSVVNQEATDLGSDEIESVEEYGNLDYPPVQYRSYKFTDENKMIGWFFLFCFFWTANFITAYGDMTVSMSVAKWYFTREKSMIGSLTVFASLFHTGYYHAGTLAFGSLVLAIIQVIRAIIAKLRKYAEDSGNRFAKCLVCCCACCFWCLEKCIRFLNKNAYIQTAIFSTSFCTSAKEAFFLVLRNAARFTSVTWVSSAVLIIGKLFISSCTTVIGFILLEQNRDDMDLNSIWGPVVLIFLISFIISDFFMDVYEMGISTVLHCLIADEEMFEPGQQYADRSLQKYVDDAGND